MRRMLADGTTTARSTLAEISANPGSKGSCLHSTRIFPRCKAVSAGLPPSSPHRGSPDSSGEWRLGPVYPWLRKQLGHEPLTTLATGASEFRRADFAGASRLCGSCVAGNDGQPSRAPLW
jgi:hypothetical protein